MYPLKKIFFFLEIANSKCLITKSVNLDEALETVGELICIKFKCLYLNTNALLYSYLNNQAVYNTLFVLLLY